MNFLTELAEATDILIRCEKFSESQKARMNFIINLVTILEVFSKKVILNSMSERSLDFDSFPLSLILQVANSAEEKRTIFKMVQIRNEIVHEGKTTTLADNDINTFRAVVKQIISQQNRNL